MMRTEMEKDDGFCINVYSPGNFIAKEIHIGTLNMGAQTENNGYGDEQVAQALMACVGDDKVINNMRKWAGAYWCLRWKSRRSYMVRSASACPDNATPHSIVSVAVPTGGSALSSADLSSLLRMPTAEKWRHQHIGCR